MRNVRLKELLADAYDADKKQSACAKAYKCWVAWWTCKDRCISLVTPC
jgi:hypothetical protein